MTDESNYEHRGAAPWNRPAELPEREPLSDAEIAHLAEALAGAERDEQAYAEAAALEAAVPFPRSGEHYPGSWPLFRTFDALDPDAPRWTCAECLAARVEQNEVFILAVAPASRELDCQDCGELGADAAAQQDELRRLPR